MMAPRRTDNGQSGFTLIEALAAMALMGLIMSAIAGIASQWLPSWNRGFDRIQRSEAIGTALDRISADIAAAEFMRPSRDAKNVIFDGAESSVTFARTSLGPNAVQGLDVVRIGEAVDRESVVLARSRAAFVPGDALPSLADPVVLLRAPYQLSFSFAGSNRIWKNSWHDAQGLPSAVLLTLRDTTAETAVVSRVAVINISESAENLCARAEGGCGARRALSSREGRNATGGPGQ
jgi:general secretion pathway protein J